MNAFLLHLSVPYKGKTQHFVLQSDVPCFDVKCEVIPVLTLCMYAGSVPQSASFSCIWHFVVFICNCLWQPYKLCINTSFLQNMPQQFAGYVVLSSLHVSKCYPCWSVLDCVTQQALEKDAVACEVLPVGLISLRTHRGLYVRTSSLLGRTS